jgi:hypothetical protein
LASAKNSGEYTARSQTNVKRLKYGSAANSAALGWPGSSVLSRGIMLWRSTFNIPGSTGWVTTKKGCPSIALTQ